MDSLPSAALVFALAVEMPFDLAPMDVAIFSEKNFRKARPIRR